MGRFLFLGTGGSMGVPVIACKCPVCSSDSPFNRRLRPSALISLGTHKLLIDIGPDFRSQALHYRINHLDGVLLTHAHHDHTAGIDELRIYYTLANEKPIPCLMSQETYMELKTRFSYMFIGSPQATDIQFISKLTVQLLEEKRGITHFTGVPIGYVTYQQAGMSVNGYRFGNLAYISDIRSFPESIFEDLRGVTHLILSALRFTPSPLHLNVDEAIAFSQQVGAENTWLTHISHELDHRKAEAYLPPNVKLAYDGLEIIFNEQDRESF